MLYRITPSMTTNNFSTDFNEEISLNDQRYSYFIYEKFFDRDYQNCTKRIILQSKNAECELQCYNTWHRNCMMFVRNEKACESYRNPLQEYLYYVQSKNETPIGVYQPRSIYIHFIHGIVYIYAA
jgi:hypothetical protein